MTGIQRWTTLSSKIKARVKRMIMEREQSPSPEDQMPQSAPPWLQYANPEPQKSKFEELIQNPLAVLAIGIAIGVIIVSMRPIVVQSA
jgi:hypothetical protein